MSILKCITEGSADTLFFLGFEKSKPGFYRIPATTIIFVMTGLLIQPSTAIAPMIVLGLLNLGGYNEHKSNIRNAPPLTKQIIFIVANTIPAVLSIFSFLAMISYQRKGNKKTLSTAPAGQQEQEPVKKEERLVEGERLDTAHED